MNTDILEGKWKQIKGKVREQWGELTNDEVDQIAGKRTILVGKLQEKYGYTKDQAREEVNNFLSGIEV